MTNVTTSSVPFPYTGASSITTTPKTTYTTSSMPGAWLYSTFGSIPIYNSISDLSANQYKFNNSAAYIRVLPGYKVIYYTVKNFGDTSTTVDFTNNSYQLFTTVTNVVSLRLYYQGIEIKNNNIPINIPYSITNSNSSNMIDNTGLLYYYPFDTDVVNYSSALDGNTYELSSATLSTSTTKLTLGSLAIASGGHFRVPEHKIDSSVGYSIALWYKLGSVSGIGASARIIQLATKINIGDDIFITYPIAGSSAMQFSPRGSTGGYTYDLNYTMDTNWHHICVTCSIGGYWTVYIDSVEVSMTNQKSIPTSRVINYWYINKSSYTGNGNASCNINQLLIFNRELKPYEIYYLYQNPTTVQLGYMQSQISNTSLQYYYPLNNNFNDISNSTFTEGGIDNGIYTGITSLDTRGISSSKSLRINSSGFFQVPAHYITTNYSIAMWFKLNSNSSGTYSRVFDFNTGLNGNGAINSGLILYFRNALSGKLFFTPNDINSPEITTTTRLDTNWHHICVTHSNNSWIIYVDALSVGTTTFAPTTRLLTDCYIGRSTFENGKTDCNVNQLAVFSKTLTLLEIQTLKNNPTQPIILSNLIYYYPFNRDFFDYSKSTCTPNGFTITRSVLKISNGSYLQIPNHYITTNYSISFWFKVIATVSNPATFSDYDIIFNFNDFLVMRTNSNRNTLYLFNLTLDDGNYDVWTHFCITYNNNTFYTYINSLPTTNSSFARTPPTAIMTNCFIGKSNPSTSVDYNQIAIFDKSLSITEIQELYNNPTSPITLSNILYYYPYNSFEVDNIFAPINPNISLDYVGTDNSTHTNVNINRGEGINNGEYIGITSLDTSTTKMTTSSLKISNSGTAFFQVPSHYIPINYSIAFWVKLNAISTGTWSRLIDFSSAKDGAAGGGPILFFQTPNSASLGFSPSAGAPNNYDRYTMDLNWHHMCITYDGSTSTWNLYIDGSFNFTTVHTATVALLNYCYIAKSNWSVVSDTGNTNCNINQFAIFSKTLSINEVKDLSNNPTKPITVSNLMYYYPFDTDFYDHSQLQMMNRSANINSSVGWIKAPSHYINPTGYSISLWFKLNSYPTVSNARIFDFSPALEAATLGGVVIFFPTANTGALFFTPFNNGSTNRALGYTMDLNWHHICVTYSASNVWNVYVDASLCYTETMVATTNLLNFCYIGKGTFSADGNVNCNVKQLAIYQRTLKVDEIRFLYDNPNCPLNNNTITNTTLSNYYPCFPGCYLFVNNKTATPVYASISNQHWNFDQDGAWWVLPGYKIVVYSSADYTGSSFIVDNTYGFNNMCKMSDNPNTVNSIKLYYKGQEIIHGGILNTINYTLNNSIPSNIPYKYICNNNLDAPITNNSQTSFPGAWIITTSGTYPIYETIYDLSVIGANQSGIVYDILPGFKLVVYTSTFLNGTATSYWNDGYSIYRVYAPTSTVMNSVALYFHGLPIAKKRYSNPNNIHFAISTRLVVPSYTGAIMNIRRSSDSVTQDFYSDAQQTYLTTGQNNTGQTYSSWIFGNTGYITKMYDQSGKANHCTNTTISAQPRLSLYNGKYVMQFTRANATCLNITTPCNPNTIFSHFYNVDVSVPEPGSNIYTIITTPVDYELRFIVTPPNSYGNFASVSGADWYVYCTGNKNAYVNNYPSTISGFNWNIIALSAQTTNTPHLFNRIGTDGFHAMRGLNGYMTEMICHNSEMSVLDMQQYYADQLALTQNALHTTTTPTTYGLNTTYYPSQVKGIWNELQGLAKINISFTYTFNYTEPTNSGIFYVAVDDYAWVIINGGAPTYVPIGNWGNTIGVTGTMPIINGINTIEIIAYNYDLNSPNALTGGAACFGAFYDSNNTLVAYTSNEWKTKIVNTINQTSLFADPIQGGLWVTTYSFTENEGYYSITEEPTRIKTPNYYLNIPNVKPVSSQVVSVFSSSSIVNPLVNANCNLWGFKAVGYFVPNATGIWTFSMFGDDIAQIWIGESATNPLSTPTASCINQSKTFTVSVTINVKYPILIYMGNSQPNYGINNGNNPNGFVLSAKNPDSVNVTLSTVFYYLNCPPTDSTPVSSYFYDGIQRSVYAGKNYETERFGVGNTTDFPSQSLCIWSEPNFRGISYPIGPFILLTYTFNYTGESNTGTYKIIVDDIAYLYFNGSAPNRCDWENTCSGTIPLINGTNYIQAIVYNTGGHVGFLASFFDSTNTLVAYTDGSWKYQLLSYITSSASPLYNPVQGGLWTKIYSYSTTLGIPFTYNGGSSTTIANATYYYTNLDRINYLVVSSKVVSNFNISSFSSTNTIYTETTGNVAWGFKASGFFVPDVTGSWTFSLNADDCAELWIGSDATGNITSICPSSTSSTTNANIRSLLSIGSTYSVTLISGRYYPILLYYGQGAVGQFINFTYKPSASALAQTVDKYLYYVNAPPTY